MHMVSGHPHECYVKRGVRIQISRCYVGAILSSKVRRILSFLPVDDVITILSDYVYKGSCETRIEAK